MERRQCVYTEDFHDLQKGIAWHSNQVVMKPQTRFVQAQQRLRDTLWDEIATMSSGWWLGGRCVNDNKHIFLVPATRQNNPARMIAVRGLTSWSLHDMLPGRENYNLFISIPSPNDVFVYVPISPGDVFLPATHSSMCSGECAALKGLSRRQMKGFCCCCNSHVESVSGVFAVDRRLGDDSISMSFGCTWSTWQRTKSQ